MAAVVSGAVRLLDARGNVLGEWALPLAPMDAASGDKAALLEIGLLPEGNYLLESGGEKRGVKVEKQPWEAVTAALIKGLYYQRCGCALGEAQAGVYARPACHTATAEDWQDPAIRRKVTGGWHDAGDYGKYTGPGEVAAAHLFYAWKLFPQGCPDGLNISETGNGVLDILNEARYELEWLLQMQRADGAFHHKLTKARFAPFIMPQDDLEKEYLMPVSHCVTGAACACLALGSRVYRAYDAAFANRMLLSALRAWHWLEANPELVPFQNPEGVRTGQYGDQSDRDERFWAACELMAATGEERFRQAAEDLYAPGQHLTGMGWADVGGLGALCCLFDLREKAGDILYPAQAGFPNAKRTGAGLVPGFGLWHGAAGGWIWMGQHIACSQQRHGHDLT